MGAAFSPDGHWLAYHSNESGKDEVYVQSLDGLDLLHLPVYPRAQSHDVSVNLRVIGRFI
jgi:Tol biopolymer transport system component